MKNTIQNTKKLGKQKFMKNPKKLPLFIQKKYALYIRKSAKQKFIANTSIDVVEKMTKEEIENAVAHYEKEIEKNTTGNAFKIIIIALLSFVLT